MHPRDLHPTRRPANQWVSKLLYFFVCLSLLTGQFSFGSSVDRSSRFEGLALPPSSEIAPGQSRLEALYEAMGRDGERGDRSPTDNGGTDPSGRAPETGQSPPTQNDSRTPTASGSTPQGSQPSSGGAGPDQSNSNPASQQSSPSNERTTAPSEEGNSQPADSSQQGESESAKTKQTTPKGWYLETPANARVPEKTVANPTARERQRSHGQSERRAPSLRNVRGSLMEADKRSREPNNLALEMPSLGQSKTLSELTPAPSLRTNRLSNESLGESSTMSNSDGKENLYQKDNSASFQEDDLFVSDSDSAIGSELSQGGIGPLELGNKEGESSQPWVEVTLDKSESPQEELSNKIENQTSSFSKSSWNERSKNNTRRTLSRLLQQLHRGMKRKSKIKKTKERRLSVEQLFSLPKSLSGFFSSKDKLGMAGVSQRPLLILGSIALLWLMIFLVGVAYRRKAEQR